MRGHKFVGLLSLILLSSSWSELVVAAEGKSLTRELRQESAKSGLCLAQVGGTSYLRIVPFGGPAVEANLGRHALMGRFSQDGRTAIVYAGRTLAVMSGRNELWRATTGLAVNDAAVSPDLQRIAVVGVDNARRAAGIFVVSKGDESPRAVHGFGSAILPPDPRAGRSPIDLILSRAAAPSWSPDGKVIAFSAEGKMYMYEVDAGEEMQIGAGTAPSWSADGQNLAFLAPDCAVTIGDAKGKMARRLQIFAATSSTIRWSPNGRYILVNRSAKRNTRCGQQTVYRVSDGAMYSLGGSCDVGDSGLGWLVLTAGTWPLEK